MIREVVLLDDIWIGFNNWAAVETSYDKHSTAVCGDGGGGGEGREGRLEWVQGWSQGTYVVEAADPGLLKKWQKQFQLVLRVCVEHSYCFERHRISYCCLDLSRILCIRQQLNCLQEDLRHTYQSDLRHTHLSDLRHTHLGDLRHTYLDDLRHTHLGDLRHTHLGDLRHTYLGDLRHTHLGDLRHTYLGDLRHVHTWVT